LLKQQLHALQLTAGILIKSTRSYKRPGTPDGLRQADVAMSSGKAQGEISRFENGTLLFPDPTLRLLLQKYGFDMTAPGGTALLRLLQFLRDEGENIAKIENEKPK
jgi:transcriptional regulator with XRE-family HTH domain